MSGNVGRPPLPLHERKVSVRIGLPFYVLEQIRNKGYNIAHLVMDGMRHYEEPEKVARMGQEISLRHQFIASKGLETEFDEFISQNAKDSEELD